jgi:DNA-binding CsgD family transcriptional regulator
LKLIINEYTSQEIAEKLSLSQYTVDTHRKSIYRKTGAKNLIGLVRYAIDRNISFNE